MLLFVAATSREMDKFLKGNFTAALKYNAPGHWYNNREVGFLICGVGPLNAAISMERCLAGNPLISHVVNVGIAGSYDLSVLPIGSICVASREIWPEYGVRSTGFYAEPVELGFPLCGQGNEAVWNTLELANDFFCRSSDLNLDQNWVQGTSITVAGVSASSTQAEELKARFGGYMENMEGFALAYVCGLRSIPFMEVRSISNLAGSRNKKDWDFKAAFKGLSVIWPGLWH